MGDRTLLMLVVLLLPAYFTLLHEWVRPVPWGPAEPMDSHGSDKLSDAYAVHRHLKVLGYYWVSLGLVTWSTIAAADAWFANGLGLRLLDYASCTVSRACRTSKFGGSFPVRQTSHHLCPPHSCSA